MNIRTVVAALSLTVLGAAQAATVPTITKGVLTIGMEGTYAPFTFKDASGQLTGFDVDIAKAIAAKLGLKPQFVLTEWSGILAGIPAGKYDIVANQVGPTAERQKTLGFSKPYAYSRAQIIVKKGSSFKPASLNDLKGKRVGVGLGSNYEKQLRDVSGINVVTYPGAPEYLADLAAGRLDAAYNDKLLVGYLIKKQGLPVVGAGVGSAAAPVAIAMKKDNVALKAAVDKALLQIKADGTYAKISRQWFGADVSKP